MKIRAFLITTKVLIYLKDCRTALKEAPPAAARETLPIVSTKVESIAQCGTVPVPPITGPSKMSKSWLTRGAAQYLGKMKEDSGRKKRAHELGQLPTSLAALMDQFWEFLWLEYTVHKFCNIRMLLHSSIFLFLLRLALQHLAVAARSMLQTR